MFSEKRRPALLRHRFSACERYISDKARIRTNNHILLKHLGLLSPSKGNKFLVGAYIFRRWAISSRPFTHEKKISVTSDNVFDGRLDAIKCAQPSGLPSTESLSTR